MPQKLKNKKYSEPVGFYLHIPYCVRRCSYCDFCSSTDSSTMQRYEHAVLHQIGMIKERYGSLTIDSIYFGGGTPTYFGAERIARILDRIILENAVSARAEITVEGNPDSVTAEGMKILSAAGVNRISIGMQSADDRELQEIGRVHRTADTVAAVRAARDAGIRNVSLDLIYGLPGQTKKTWTRTLQYAASLEPKHISAYGLTLEPGTSLYKRAEEGEPFPDDDMQAELYLTAVDLLEAAGYRQYEISNFAVPGYASQHNLKYWRVQPYIGIGASAHSDFKGVRSAMTDRIPSYIEAIEEDTFPVSAEVRISAAERSKEELMLGMRLAEGIDLKQFGRKNGIPTGQLEGKFLEYARQHWAQYTDPYWHLTPRGFLVSNQLIGEMLDILERSDGAQ